ncbi:MAG: hypothetical protein NC432_05225 [Roseburia sp.]|nr:hypothetical protein [Roseburia sp.]MCM1097909.1 hypothetical protein [Ruminococcus flavefaciens]
MSLAKKARTQRLEDRIFMILILGSVLVNIKNIFTGFDLDAEYALVMSYRMVRGDRMFLQMWEPHQTSAFLSAALIWLYLTLFRTTTGIVVYMNLSGVILKGAVTLVLYRTLRKYANKKTLICLCVFYFTFNPKGILLPEFSNMQLWFSTLLFCSLFYYIRNQEKKRWLLLSGVFLCLEVLSYPSCAIVYFGVLICLILYARNRAADILLLTGECVVCGGLYVSYFVSQIGASELCDNIAEIISGDKSHSGGTAAKWAGYGRDLAEILVVLLIFAALSWGAVKLYAFVKGMREGRGRLQPRKEWYVACFFACHFIQDLFCTLRGTAGLGYQATMFVMYGHLIVYLPVCILGWTLCRFCSEEESQVCRMGIVLSVFGLAATLILSNLTVFSTLAYGALGVCVAMLPCGNVIEREVGGVSRTLRYLLVLFCGLTIFRAGFGNCSMTAEAGANVFGIRGIVKSGPAKGLVSTYMGPYMINTAMEEWEQYIEEGDRILLVKNNLMVGFLGYMYENTEICVDSTISTPTYNEKLKRYWEKNPQKQPNVVAVECWYGDLRVAEDSWIMQWLENEFLADRVVDGKYWRYYLKEE